MGCLTVTSVGHAEHPAGASDVGEATPLRGCLRAISDCARPSRGARGCDRQVVNYCTNLRRTPYELRMGKCGHRAIGPGRPALRRLVPGHGPHSRPAQGEGTEGPVGVTRQAAHGQARERRGHSKLCSQGGLTMKRRVRRLLTVGMSFAVAVAGVMLTSVALATSGAHFSTGAASTTAAPHRELRGGNRSARSSVRLDRRSCVLFSG